MNQDDVLAMHKTRMKNLIPTKRVPIYTKERVLEAIENKWWINGRGENLLIKDMSTAHINNCVKFLLQGTFIKDSLHQIKLPVEIKNNSSKIMKLFENEMNARSKDNV